MTRWAVPDRRPLVAYAGPELRTIRIRMDEQTRAQSPGCAAAFSLLCGHSETGISKSRPELQRTQIVSRGP
jgi:hypothetical protein